MRYNYYLFDNEHIFFILNNYTIMVLFTGFNSRFYVTNEINTQKKDVNKNNTPKNQNIYETHLK